MNNNVNNNNGNGNENNPAAAITKSPPDNKYQVYIADKQFMVDGKRIWMNGVNTPWNKWNDFGGEGWAAFDNNWWDNEFNKLKNAGINSVRVWINCDNGNDAIAIDSNGMINGASEEHWADVGRLLALAEKHRLYIMATLLSFDHFKSENSQQFKWVNMIKSKPAVQSFAEKYTIPFVQRFGKNPYLWSIDLMNEPDWLYEHQNIQWSDISYFFAYNAAAIHENSGVLVTVGMVYPKWMSTQNGNGDYISDSFFKQQYNNPNAHLDFYSPHYYDWVGEWFGVPYYLTPGGNINKSSKPWTGGWGLDDTKPVVLGEVPAHGSGNVWGITGKTVVNDYEEAYQNGWQGVMAWTSNAVDGNGGLDNTDLGKATRNMLDKYPQLIRP